MVSKKLLISVFTAITLLGSSAYAKPDEAKGNKKYKAHKEYKEHKKDKQKNIPYGLQKKVNNGGTLPPGWQKKIRKGQVVDQDILDSGVILNDKHYPDIRNTKVYKVQERIFRVAQDTKEILDILK